MTLLRLPSSLVSSVNDVNRMRSYGPYPVTVTGPSTSHTLKVVLTGASFWYAPGRCLPVDDPRQPPVLCHWQHQPHEQQRNRSTTQLTHNFLVAIKKL